MIFDSPTFISQTIASGSLEVTGSARFANGLSGSLTRLPDGTSYLLAGPNISIVTGSNGSITITASMGGTLGGSGTANYVPKWLSSTTLTNSQIFDDGTFVGIGVTNPSAILHVSGSSTSTLTTALIKGGTASQVGAILDVQDSTGSSILEVSGSVIEASVPIRAANGSATAPAFSFIQSTSTGMYRRTSGQLLSFAVSGNQVMGIDTNGLVGINVSATTSPLAMLQVNGASTASTATALFRAGNVSPTGAILDVQNSSATTLLLVSGSGFVGVGTVSNASTSYIFGVRSGADSQIGVRTLSGIGAGGTGAALDSLTDAGAVQNFGIRAATYQFLVSPTTLSLYIASGGNVGIGSTTTISARLQVSGSGTASTSTMVVREGVSSPTGGVGVFDVQNSAGTSILFVSGSGVVGIGTTTTLDATFKVARGTAVNGTAMFMGTTAHSHFNYSTAEDTYIRGGKSTSRVFVNDTLSGDVVIATGGGNVGIGTATFTGRFFISGSSTASIPTTVLRAGTPSPTGPVLDVQDYLGNTLLVVSGSGNVGVGTNNPAARFHVSDNQANSTVRFHLANINGSGGPLRVGYFSDSSGFHITANGNPAHTNLISNTVTRDYTARFAFEMLNVLTTTSDNSYVDFRFAGGSTFSSAMRIRADGNVGIGTTGIDSRLVVNGNSVFSGSVNPDSDLSRDLGSSTKRWNNVYAANISGSLTGSNVTAGQVVVAGTGGVLSGSNLFWWNNTNGNVGIGSTTAATRLDVRGVSGTSGATVQIVGNGVSTLLLGQNADGGVVRGQGGNNALSFWTGGSGDTGAGGSGSERVRIDSTGNVGIGTSTVQTYSGYTVLDIDSTTNGGLLNLKKAGSTVGYINAVSGLQVLATTGNDMYLTVAGSNAIFFRTNATDRLTINSVGVVAPGADNTQDFGSSALRWRNIFATNISGSLTGSNVTAGQVVVAGTGGVLSGSNNFFWNNTNRRVGIGNSTPNNALTVVGNVDFRESTSSGNYLQFTPGTSYALISSNVGVEITAGANYFVVDANGYLFRNTAGSVNNAFIDSSTGNVGIGSTTTLTARLQVSGSSTATTPTMIVREGVVSPTGGAKTFEVQKSTGTTLLYVSGSGEIGVGTDASIITSTATTTSISTTTLLSVSSVTFRSAEFIVQGIDTTGGKYHTAKIIAVHNGSITNFTEYGSVSVGGIAGTFNVTDPSSGTFLLQVTAASTNSTVWKTTAILTKA